jgi:surfeit locus 1 family protein
MPWNRLLLPVLVVLPVLATLLGLGTWQWQRLAWKNAVLAEIAAAESAAARPLGAAPPPPWTTLAATGRFDHGREALLGLEVRGPVLGAHLLVPLLRDGAPPVLVDRGWVPLERAAAIARPEGLVAVEGFARPGETAGLFAATDDVAGRRFYTFDPARIGAALGLAEVAPFGLVALGGPGGLPDPARSLPRPANSHLGYVITWYGLALSLLGVFLAWARRRMKEPT